MKCFYHKQTIDGRCAGAIIKEKYPKCELFGVQHNYALDMDLINEGELVFVVSFCFTREEMMKINKKADLRWIDHRQADINMMEGFRWYGAQQGVGASSCQLTWKYVHGYSADEPLAVSLIGRYEQKCFDNPMVLQFVKGLSTQDTQPESTMWGTVLRASHLGLAHIFSAGKAIIIYEKQRTVERFNKAIEETNKFTANLDNFKLDINKSIIEPPTSDQLRGILNSDSYYFDKTSEFVKSINEKARESLKINYQGNEAIDDEETDCPQCHTYQDRLKQQSKENRKKHKAIRSGLVSLLKMLGGKMPKDS